MWQEKGRTTRYKSKRETITAAGHGPVCFSLMPKEPDFHSADGLLGYFAKVSY